MQGLKWALPAGVLAYGAWFATDYAQDNGFVSLKNPTPMAFGIDKAATSVFTRIHKYRKLGDDADALYRRMMRQTDKILVLEKKLLKGATPDYEDRMIVIGYDDCAREAMREFLKLIHKNYRKSGKEIGKERGASLKEIDADFSELLKAHVKNVFKLTADAPVHVIDDDSSSDDDYNSSDSD